MQKSEFQVLEWAVLHVVTFACVADRWKLFQLKKKVIAAFSKGAQAK